MSFGSIEGAAIRLDRSSLEELARILARKDVAAMPTTRLLRAAAAMPIAAAARSSKPSTRHRSRRASGSLLANPSATIFLSALVQASVSALRRYASRERRTPMRWRGACTSWRGYLGDRSPRRRASGGAGARTQRAGRRARHLPHLPGGSPSTSRPRRRLLRSLREGLAASSSAAASSGPTTATAASSSSSDGGRPWGVAGRKRRPAGGAASLPRATALVSGRRLRPEAERRVRRAGRIGRKRSGRPEHRDPVRGRDRRNGRLLLRAGPRTARVGARHRPRKILVPDG